MSHAAVAAAAWYRCRRLGKHYGTAWIASLLFAVHPWLADPLAAGDLGLPGGAAACLAAWWLHDRKWTLAAAGALAVAAFLRPGHVLLVGLLMLVDREARRRSVAPRLFAGAIAGLALGWTLAPATLRSPLGSSPTVALAVVPVALALAIAVGPERKTARAAFGLIALGGSVALAVLGGALAIGHVAAGLARPGRRHVARKTAVVGLTGVLLVGEAWMTAERLRAIQSGSTDSVSNPSRAGSSRIVSIRRPSSPA